jgi:hypothetical protein
MMLRRNEKVGCTIDRESGGNFATSSDTIFVTEAMGTASVGLTARILQGGIAGA